MACYDPRGYKMDLKKNVINKEPYGGNRSEVYI